MITLSPEEQKHLELVQSFAREAVAPAAASWTRGQSPEPQIMAAAAELGLFRLQVPAEDGGLGASFSLKAAACQALAAADFGLAMSLVNTHNVAAKLAAHGSTALKKKHLPALLWGQAHACTALTEPQAGSDVAAMQTRAVKSAGGWVLDGEKSWITNARNASTAIVYAQCGDVSTSRTIGAFLVDLTAPECRRSSIRSDFAQSSTGTGGFRMSCLHLPEENLLVAPGEAFRAIMAELNGARAYVAAMCCGMLDSALEIVSGYGKSRSSFGRALAEHQMWRLQVAEAETTLAAAQGLAAQAAAAIDAGSDAQLISAQAKIFAVQACKTHLPAMLHAMGAEGLNPEHPFARHVGAAQIAGLVDGSTEMLLERVAKLSRHASLHKRS